MNVGNPPGTVVNPKIMPRGGRMLPLTRALQLALFRIDKGDTVPRIVKLGELVARMALAGDRDMIKLAFDRIDGKVEALDDKGEPIDLHSQVLQQLVTLLVEHKREERTANVVDVVATMVDNKTKE